jgi:Neprosin
MVATLGLLSSSLVFPHPASAKANGFTPFSSFFTQLRHTTFDSFVRGHVSWVKKSSDFSQMRSYLEQLYAGADVRESFISDGSYFDCITLATQPTVTALGLNRIAQAPPKSLATRAVHGATGTWTTSGTNQQGEVVSCPDGTVPIRRTTLSQVASYHSLHDFLTKGMSAAPDGAGRHYRHAHGYQFTDNYGASSIINVWNPSVPAPAGIGDDHSLSQQWVTGGSGAGLQTAEAGWTKDPGFSTAGPVFFIFFTPDDYQSGCYNVECTAFVQTNSSVGLGAVVNPCCSAKLGANDSFTQEWYLYNSAWWLAINGVWIGYYPTSVYNGGQMSHYATEVDFGGEVNASETNQNWPQMGSGKPASKGYEKAAYQSSIEYIGLDSKAYWTNLTTDVTGSGASPSPCYSLSYAPASGSTGTYFYFGGPGGPKKTC